MIRFVAAAGAIALGGLIFTDAVAQQDVIKDRQALMKRSGQQMGAVNRMIRGQEPFDAAKAAGAFDAWADKAQKLPNIFPASSKTGETRALPKIWEDASGWNAQIAKFQKDIADNRAKAVANLDGLKAAVPVILDDCNSCHQTYRQPRN